MPRPGRVTPEKSLYPLYSTQSGSQGRAGRVREISPPPGFDPRNVKPVASRYTDWVIPTYKQVYVLDYPCIPFPSITPDIQEYTVHWCLGTRLNQRVPNCCSRIPRDPRLVARGSEDTFL